LLLTTRLLWAVCLFVYVALSVCFFIKNQLVSIHVSVHVSRSAMRPIATVSHMAWSVYYFVHFPLRVRSTSTDDTRIMVSLSVCLCPWLLCLSVFFIKNQLVSIHMFLYMYRGLRCGLLLQCPTWHDLCIILCIFRYVYGLLLLMTHVLWSVCLFVCVLGWFVCLSFPSKTSSYLSPVSLHVSGL